MNMSSSTARTPTSKSVRILDPFLDDFDAIESRDDVHQATLDLLYDDDDSQLLDLEDMLPYHSDSARVNAPQPPSRSPSPSASSLYQRALRLHEYKRSSPAENASLSWRERINASPVQSTISPALRFASRDRRSTSPRSRSSSPAKISSRMSSSPTRSPRTPVTLKSKGILKTNGLSLAGKKMEFDLGAIERDAKVAELQELWDKTKRATSKGYHGSTAITIANPYAYNQSPNYVHPFDDAATAPIAILESPTEESAEETESVKMEKIEEASTDGIEIVRNPTSNSSVASSLPDESFKVAVAHAAEDAAIDVIDIDAYFASQTIAGGSKFRAYDFPRRKIPRAPRPRSSSRGRPAERMQTVSEEINEEKAVEDEVINVEEEVFVVEDDVKFIDDEEATTYSRKSSQSKIYSLIEELPKKEESGGSSLYKMATAARRSRSPERRQKASQLRKERSKSPLKCSTDTTEKVECVTQLEGSEQKGVTPQEAEQQTMASSEKQAMSSVPMNGSGVQNEEKKERKGPSFKDLPKFNYRHHLHNQKMADQVISTVYSKETSDRAVHGLAEMAFREKTDNVSDIKKTLKLSDESVKPSLVCGLPEDVEDVTKVIGEDVVKVLPILSPRKKMTYKPPKLQSPLKKAAEAEQINAQTALRVLESKRFQAQHIEDPSESSISVPGQTTSRFAGRDSPATFSKASILESDVDEEMFDSKTLPYMVQMLDKGCAWIEQRNGIIPCEADDGMPSLYRTAAGKHNSSRRGEKKVARQPSPKKFKSPRHKSTADPIGISSDSSSEMGGETLTYSRGDTFESGTLDRSGTCTFDESTMAEMTKANSFIELPPLAKKTAQSKMDPEESVGKFQHKLSKRMEAIRIQKERPDAPESRKTLSPRNRSSPTRSRTMGGPEGFATHKPKSPRREMKQAGWTRRDALDLNENDPRLAALELAERLRLRAEALKEKKSRGRHSSRSHYMSHEVR